MSDPIYIFLCNKHTRDEVLKKRLVGTTRIDWHRDMEGIRIGHRVLVYDYDRFEFLGPFEVSAVDEGRPIDRTAWGGKFPCQARLKPVGEERHISIESACKRVGRDQLMRSSSSMPRSLVGDPACNELADLFGFPETADTASQDAPRERLPADDVQTPGEERTQRVFKTRQGFAVRSKAERAIADLLAEWRINCHYETLIPGGSAYRCDFYLPDYDVYIEYWGLDSPEYMRRREVKTREYARCNLRLVELEPDDERDLEERLLQKLARFVERPPAVVEKRQTWLARLTKWLRTLIRGSH
jgi:hypothetical protein